MKRLVVILTLAVPVAKAEIVNYNYMGVVRDSSWAGAQIGDSFTGSFSINFDAIQWNQDENNTYYNAFLNGISSINNNSFKMVSEEQLIVSNQGLSSGLSSTDQGGYSEFDFVPNTPFADQSLGNANGLEDDNKWSLRKWFLEVRDEIGEYGFDGFHVMGDILRTWVARPTGEAHAGEKDGYHDDCN